MVLALNSLLVLSLVIGVTQGSKDDSYYNANSGNPNVGLKMYWKDAENVLQDLSQFSSLYVEFNSCVWSWMQYSYSDNDIDENDYWYMGSVPPMGANVAYSLYGSLSGEKFKGCGQDTFINSFYTNSGFTDFAAAMKYAGRSGFYGYTGNQDDDSYISAKCQGGYGVGCDTQYGFAMHKYSGDECDPTTVTGVADNLSTLNQAMQGSQCVKIYDRSTYKGYVEGTPLELLQYSTACSYMNYWSPDGTCPDPYGKIKYYVQNYNKGITKKREDPFKNYDQNMEKGRKMAVTGAVFLTVAVFILLLGRTKLLKRYTWTIKMPSKKTKKTERHDDDETVPEDDTYILQNEKVPECLACDMYIQRNDETVPEDDTYSLQDEQVPENHTGDMYIQQNEDTISESCEDAPGSFETIPYDNEGDTSCQRNEKPVQESSEGDAPILSITNKKSGSDSFETISDTEVYIDDILKTTPDNSDSDLISKEKLESSLEVKLESSPSPQEEIDISAQEVDTKLVPENATSADTAEIVQPSPLPASQEDKVDSERKIGNAPANPESSTAGTHRMSPEEMAARILRMRGGGS